MTKSDYPKLVSQAEKAVAGVKDPDLKRIAFQKILDDLLGASETATSDRPSRKAEKIIQKSSKPQKTPSGTTGHIEMLIDDGFFKVPKTMTQIKAELQNEGHHIPLNELSTPLRRLCKKRTLRREKIKTSGNKSTYAYSKRS